MLARVLVFLLRVYRWTISPLLGPVCRFQPSCSHYAEGCLLTHGLFRGSILTVKRLAKCHPFHPGGYDPVPPRGYRHGSKLAPRQTIQPPHNVRMVPAVTSQEGLP